jgi:hypothetical protein
VFYVVNKHTKQSDGSEQHRFDQPDRGLRDRVHIVVVHSGPHEPPPRRIQVSRNLIETSANRDPLAGATVCSFRPESGKKPTASSKWTGRRSATATTRFSWASSCASSPSCKSIGKRHLPAHLQRA